MQKHVSLSYPEVLSYFLPSSQLNNFNKKITTKLSEQGSGKLLLRILGHKTTFYICAVPPICKACHAHYSPFINVVLLPD